MSEQNETMTIADIAKEFGISRATVNRRMKQGILKPLNVSGVLYRQHKLIFNRRQVIQALNNSVTAA